MSVLENQSNQPYRSSISKCFGELRDDEKIAAIKVNISKKTMRTEPDIEYAARVQVGLT